MYVGFAGSNANIDEDHMILAWIFSNTNFSIGDALVTESLPSFVSSKISESRRSVFRSKWFIIGVNSLGIFLLVSSWFVVNM